MPHVNGPQKCRMSPDRDIVANAGILMQPVGERFSHRHALHERTVRSYPRPVSNDDAHRVSKQQSRTDLGPGQHLGSGGGNHPVGKQSGHHCDTAAFQGPAQAVQHYGSKTNESDVTFGKAAKRVDCVWLIAEKVLEQYLEKLRRAWSILHIR